uniref:Uncharacterized protein n=1 Tax=Oryza brachyantha TaxID=4533 RepID=J3MDY9_ORYBR
MRGTKYGLLDPPFSSVHVKTGLLDPVGSYNGQIRFCNILFLAEVEIKEEEDDEVGKGAAVVPAEDVKASEVGLVMQGWDVEEEDNTLVDNVEDDDDEEQEEEEDEGDAETDKECEEQVRDSSVSMKEAECHECVDPEDDDSQAGEVDPVETEAVGISECGDLGEEVNEGGCGGDGQKIDPEEAPILRKDSALEVALSGEAVEREIQLPDMMKDSSEAKEEVSVPRPEKEEEMKGRRSTSCCSPSTALKEDRKLRRLSSRRRVGSSSRASSGSDRVGRRHSFSAEIEARRSSFSSLKDSRRASFSIDRDGRRWSFSIEQEHLVAEPKVLMGSRKGQKISSEPESEKDCVVHAAPNSAEEAQESHDDGKEEATVDGEEEGTTQETEVDEKGEKVEVGGVEAQDVVEEQKLRRKKSGELPDCLLLMMYEPKLSMEVSKETWVCSTDFVHWKSYKGHNRRNRCQQKTGCNAAASEELKDTDNAEGTSDAKNMAESEAPASVNLASMPPPVVQKPPPKEAAEQKLKIELPLVTSAATYAPFVLKRCKSEPMRSSARLAPDACFWKDRHRPLNATGVGF